jgi:hypothetical protein
MGQAPQVGRRTIRRQQLRDIVPRADSTIYDMERGIFSREGMDRDFTDLPVVPVCRSCALKLRLRAKQISS